MTKQVLITTEFKLYLVDYINHEIEEHGAEDVDLDMINNAVEAFESGAR